MDISEHTQSLRRDLSAAAALGDENTRRVADALADAVETSARLMLISALSDFAEEVSRALGDRTVHVRLRGTDVAVEVSAPDAPNDPTSGSDTTGGTFDFEEFGGDISRVTLRLVEQVKARAEDAAAQNGVSLNSWVAQAVQGALSDQMRRARPDTRSDRRDDTQ